MIPFPYSTCVLNKPRNLLASHLTCNTTKHKTFQANLFFT
uniref:Uncharacterized protein n=1 Tax=Rhizophora mucronata TaxID=61149 RepID=A0A2P2JBW1_RHIMU